MFFFFQAEDGIRDLTVTGVQTCALPICNPVVEAAAAARERISRSGGDRGFRYRVHGVDRADDALRPGLPDDSSGTGVCNADREPKSTCLNSSHRQISYAAFCLKTQTKPL